MKGWRPSRARGAASPRGWRRLKMEQKEQAGVTDLLSFSNLLTDWPPEEVKLLRPFQSRRVIRQHAPLEDGGNVRASHLFQVDFLFQIKSYFLFAQCDIRGGSSLKVREANQGGGGNDCNSLLMCRGCTQERRGTDPVSMRVWIFSPARKNEYISLLYRSLTSFTEHVWM